MRFFFLMIRRPPRSTLDRSSAASDVYKRQTLSFDHDIVDGAPAARFVERLRGLIEGAFGLEGIG